MKTIVAVKDIAPNPFQARKKIDRDTIRSLAEEIQNFGLWPGALRGRWKNGKVELCYGHRRLEAIKLLGWTEVEVDIVDMGDDEMALQGLAENLQREELTDLEKAEGIRLMVRRYMKEGLSESEAVQKVARQLGLSTAWAKDLLSLLEMPESVQKAIRGHKIAGRTALEAHRLGGSEMVRTAAKNKLTVHKLSKIAQKVRRIPDEKVRKQVKKEVVSGKIKEPEKIDERARMLLKKSGRRVKIRAEDMEEVARSWTSTLRKWEEQIDELQLYRSAIRKGEGPAKDLRKQIEALIEALKKLV